MLTPPIAFFCLMENAITGVGVSLLVSNGSSPDFDRISAVAKANSFQRNRVSYPIITSGLFPYIFDFLRFNSALRVIASPCAANRRFWKVKSRAINPRHPEVPNLIGDFTLIR